jgi:hypothetical protein
MMQENFETFEPAHVENTLKPQILDISQRAKFTESEISKMRHMGANHADLNKIAEILPMRKLMESALRRHGYPVPPEIDDLLIAFYNNVIKKSEVGKHFAYVEGNPILNKMKNSASENLVSSLIDIIPAATGFVNAALSKSNPVNDPMLIQDATDVKLFLNAKENGLPVDNIGVMDTAINPWLIAGMIIIIAILVLKK